MIFHCQAKAISRSSGRSSTAAAAYRSGERIINDRTGEIHDYRRKRGVIHKEMVFPEGAKPIPRSTLWNMAEAAEKRKDAKVAREWELALPSEMRPSERAALARDFAKALAERYGVVVDICIHAPGKKGDSRNHHAHLLTTTRSFASGRFGEKVRILDSPKTSGQEVNAIREIWERLCNAALSLVGVKERVDRRTLKAQGIDRRPTVHLGTSASEMERRGIHTDRGDHNRRTGAGSKAVAIEKEIQELQKMDNGIEDAKARHEARKSAEEKRKMENARKEAEIAARIARKEQERQEQLAQQRKMEWEREEIRRAERRGMSR
jgi:hypothetical protein